MSLRNFYAKGFTEFDAWDADPDDYQYQDRKDAVLKGFRELGHIPPQIHCVSDLKRARAELYVLEKDRIRELLQEPLPTEPAGYCCAYRCKPDNTKP